MQRETIGLFLVSVKVSKLAGFKKKVNFYADDTHVYFKSIYVVTTSCVWVTDMQFGVQMKYL